MKKSHIFFVVIFGSFLTAFGMDKGDKQVNELTNMVRSFCKQLTPDVEVQQLKKPFEKIKKFIEQKAQEDAEFKNKLNDEGMPPRIIEEELELRLRHVLSAKEKLIYQKISDTCFEENEWKQGAKFELCFDNQVRKNKDIKLIKSIIDEEMQVYALIENLNGPVVVFKNLSRRYDDYASFIKEGKKYTEQEAHVLIHLLTYENGVKEGILFAQEDQGDYLRKLLDTYIEWLPDNTHTSQEVGELIAHGSILSAKNKKGKTMLDITKELKKQAKTALKNSSFKDDIDKKFDEIVLILTKGGTDFQGKEKKLRRKSISGIESKWFDPEHYKPVVDKPRETEN